MCKFGDIIVINEFRGDDDKEIGKHSFVVIDDENGTIAGLDYSFVASVMSSFKNNKKKKLSYKGNFELSTDSIVNKKLKKETYVKVDQAYYFNKDKIDYFVFGTLNDESMGRLVKVIIDLANDGKIKRNINNLI